VVLKKYSIIVYGCGTLTTTSFEVERTSLGAVEPTSGLYNFNQYKAAAKVVRDPLTQLLHLGYEFDYSTSFN